MAKRINKIVIEYDLDKELKKIVLENGGGSHTVCKRLKSEKVHDEYMKQYPTDEMGEDINDEITFYGLLDGMRNGCTLEDILGVWDSIIRDRVFAQLAERMHVPFAVIEKLCYND